MKTKFICVFFSILMVVLSFSLTVHAEQYDSLRLPENERTDMADAPDDTVIKLYVGIFYDNFAKGQSIEEITSGNSNLTDRWITYLIISPTEGYTKMKQYYNGTVSRIRGGIRMSSFRNGLLSAIMRRRPNWFLIHPYR